LAAAPDTANYYPDGEKAGIRAKTFTIKGADLSGSTWDNTGTSGPSTVEAGHLILRAGVYTNVGNNGSSPAKQFDGNLLLQGGATVNGTSTTAGSVHLMTGNTNTVNNQDVNVYTRLLVDGLTGNVGIGTLNL
jgi:hypothetical protein